MFGMGTGGSPPPWPPEPWAMRPPALGGGIATRGQGKAAKAAGEGPAPRAGRGGGGLAAAPRACRPPAPSDVAPRTPRGSPGGTVKVSTDSYPSASRVATLAPRADQPGGLPGVFPLSSRRPHLGVGFALRCFQRLSLPDTATQPCPWRDNWYTGGRSTPVLSY